VHQSPSRDRKLSPPLPTGAKPSHRHKLLCRRERNDGAVGEIMEMNHHTCTNTSSTMTSCRYYRRCGTSASNSSRNAITRPSTQSNYNQFSPGAARCSPCVPHCSKALRLRYNTGWRRSAVAYGVTIRDGEFAGAPKVIIH